MDASVVEAFRRDGYVVVDGLLGGDELDRLAPAVSAAVVRRKAADTRVLGEKSRYEQSFLQCQNLWEDHPDVRPLTFHPRVGEAAAALLGVGAVRLWHDQALFKEPGGRETDPHQDQRRRRAARAAVGEVDDRVDPPHEVASHDPAGMPTTVWLDDHHPDDTDPATWDLTIAGRATSVASLRYRARPVVARLDCTGGWWSEQSWDAVSLRDLLGDPPGRSVRVRSATGYDRFFAGHELDDVFLAVGYGGEQLRPGHGAPVRLIAPGRRGYWWVKWVTSVEPDDRPAWVQLPFPLA